MISRLQRRYRYAKSDLRAFVHPTPPEPYPIYEDHWTWIPGAVGPTMTLANPKGGQYRVMVSNVTADSGPVTYQWQYNKRTQVDIHEPDLDEWVSEGTGPVGRWLRKRAIR